MAAPADSTSATCTKAVGEVSYSVRQYGRTITGKTVWVGEQGDILVEENKSGELTLAKQENVRNAQGEVRKRLGFAFAKGAPKKPFIHQMVAECWCDGEGETVASFRGSKEELVPKLHVRTEVNHIDFDPTNNRAANLHWVTPEQNRYFTRVVMPRGYAECKIKGLRKPAWMTSERESAFEAAFQCAQAILQGMDEKKAREAHAQDNTTMGMAKEAFLEDGWLNSVKEDW